MATLAQGFIQVQLGTTSGGSTTYTKIKGVIGIDGGGFTPSKIDATDFDTTPGTREHISGPREANAYTFPMHYEQGDAQQEALFTAMAANAAVPIRVLFGTGSGSKQISYSSVPNLVLSAPVDGKVTYTVTVEPQAAPVRETQPSS